MTSNPLPRDPRLDRPFDITEPQAAPPRRRLLYGVYAWLTLFVVVAPVALVLLVTPGVLRRRRLAHGAARVYLAAIGSPVRVTGAPPPPAGACIVIANHSSYLDGIVLAAALPPRFSFLVKHEMDGVPLAGFVLRRLQSHFVDRDSPGRRQRVARRLVSAAAEGDAFAVFPEGTFDAAPGLKRFRMGAFVAAWRAGAAIVPAVIGGTRAKLPAGALLPSPGPVTVHFEGPLAAGDYDDAGALAAAARSAMLARSGEPDLAEDGSR